MTGIIDEKALEQAIGGETSYHSQANEAQEKPAGTLRDSIKVPLFRSMGEKRRWFMTEVGYLPDNWRTREEVVVPKHKATLQRRVFAAAAPHDRHEEELLRIIKTQKDQAIEELQAIIEEAEETIKAVNAFINLAIHNIQRANEFYKYITVHKVTVNQSMEEMRGKFLKDIPKENADGQDQVRLSANWHAGRDREGG